MENSNVSIISEFIQYNNWANAQILSVCEKLSVEELQATAPGTYGTIGDTLGHIIRGEAGYLFRMTGLRLEPPFQWQDKPDVKAMSEYAARVGDALLQAVSEVEPTKIIRETENGETVEYKAIGLMIQIINHGVEHRTNITTILEQLKQTPPEVDGWGYMWANKDKFGVKEGKVE